MVPVPYPDREDDEHHGISRGLGRMADRPGRRIRAARSGSGTPSVAMKADPYALAAYRRGELARAQPRGHAILIIGVTSPFSLRRKNVHAARNIRAADRWNDQQEVGSAAGTLRRECRDHPPVVYRTRGQDRRARERP